MKIQARFPWQMYWSLGRHIAVNTLRGTKHYPLVMMLEPTHLCNLACVGCGKIREYEATIRDMAPLERLLEAVDECGAPIVSICGGEPLVYPKIGDLVNKVLARGRHIILCTNAINLDRFLPKWKPTPYFTINISMDGLRETHDVVRTRKGLYDMDLRMIRLAKSQGFRVITNTTVYRETKLEELEQMWVELEAAGVDGLLVSPGYSYQAVKTKEIFLQRQDTHHRFRHIAELGRRFRFTNTPMYFRFLRGEFDLPCTPWGNPTFNPQGWKGPCYLITDGHYQTFKELMEQTDWDRYEAKADPRCANCMMHSGFEPTVTRLVGRRWRDMWEMVRWNFS